MRDSRNGLLGVEILLFEEERTHRCHVGIFMGHRGKESVDARFKSVERDLIDEPFRLDAPLVVAAKQHFDDGVKLEVHAREILIYIEGGK